MKVIIFMTGPQDRTLRQRQTQFRHLAGISNKTKRSSALTKFPNASSGHSGFGGTRLHLIIDLIRAQKIKADSRT
jgi:hypothetical protein